MQTITPIPEVAKMERLNSCVFVCGHKIFWCGAIESDVLLAAFSLLACIQRGSSESGELAEEVALYIERESKVEFEVYCVLACERPASTYIGERRSDSMCSVRFRFRFEAEARSAV